MWKWILVQSLVPIPHFSVRWGLTWPDPDVYSYRSASKGSSRAARRAGMSLRSGPWPLATKRV